MSAMNKILENLWLGDMSAAYNKVILKKNGMTHILTVASGIPPKFPSNFTLQPSLKHLSGSMLGHSL